MFPVIFADILRPRPRQFRANLAQQPFDAQARFDLLAQFFFARARIAAGLHRGLRSHRLQRRFYLFRIQRSRVACRFLANQDARDYVLLRLLAQPHFNLDGVAFERTRVLLPQAGGLLPDDGILYQFAVNKQGHECTCSYFPICGRTVRGKLWR